MRKDKLSSYQAKKEKLKKIKNCILPDLFKWDGTNYQATIDHLIDKLHNIWEIVKDE